MFKKIWSYSTATPIQRCGVILLAIGILSFVSWVIKKDLYFEDIFDPYYMPEYRDSFVFHAYKYLIPAGLLMSCGYSFLLLIYNWIFSKKTNHTTKQKTEIMYFKNTYEAFEFACTIYPLKLEIGRGNIGLVCDIVLTLDEKFQYTIKIANNDKTILVYGYSEQLPKFINIDSLVYWKCDTIITEKNYSKIKGLGCISATIKPEFNNKNQKWSVEYDLLNTKEAI